MNKIKTNRSKFPDKVQKIPQVQKLENRFKMNVFKRASEDEIKKLILSSTSKSCDLIIITPITDINNISMETSTFPQNFKEAHVRPLLKKTSLPKNGLKNYKPVSKILEKMVANRLQAHIKNNHLSNPLQSAYRKHYSTESALLKVHISISMDKGEVTALTLIDLSAAHNLTTNYTIEHVYAYKC